jgi:hypothetical protein
MTHLFFVFAIFIALRFFIICFQIILFNIFEKIWLKKGNMVLGFPLDYEKEQGYYGFLYKILETKKDFEIKYIYNIYLSKNPRKIFLKKKNNNQEDDSNFISF